MSDIREDIDTLAIREAKNHIRVHVAGESLLHILREVSEHLGIDPGVFDAHYSILRNHYHTQYLERLSSGSEHIAAILDDLPVEAIYTGDDLQRLFPHH